MSVSKYSEVLLKNTCCLVRVSSAVMKHHNQKALWEGNGLFGLHFQITVHHWRKSGQELRQGWNWRQELMQSPWIGVWPTLHSLLSLFSYGAQAWH